MKDPTDKETKDMFEVRDREVIEWLWDSETKTFKPYTTTLGDWSNKMREEDN
jgi:hypothetical protein